MKRSDILWGLGTGLLLGIAGFGLRAFGLGYPLEGMFARITYWLGVPAAFNLVHKLLGYSDLAKNLAFIGTVGLWLAIHPVLFAFARRRIWLGALTGALFYGYFGRLLAGLIYTVLFLAIAFLATRCIARRPGVTGSSRRESLKAIGFIALTAVFWQQAKAQAKIIWEKITGLSREQTPQKDLYYVSKNPGFLDPNLAGKPYKLEIFGLVNKPAALSFDDIKAVPPVELVNTLTCISNPVGGDLIGSPKWQGASLKTLLEKAGVKPEAKWLVWEAADSYRESILLSEVPAEAMLAYAIENEQGKWEELQTSHGYPTRLLLPGRYGMKQPKWITKIRLSDKEEPGYWVQRGWSKSAVIRTMSRIDTPKNNARIRAGEENFIAGIAYAGGRALERVEISTDGGKSWQNANLKPPRSKFAWQQWAFSWRPSVGEYQLAVRAVEVGDKIQDATRRNPLPDGATGYHVVKVRVS